MVESAGRHAFGQLGDVGLGRIAEQVTLARMVTEFVQLSGIPGFVWLDWALPATCDGFSEEWQGR